MTLAETDITQILSISLLLIGLLVVGFLVAAQARRRLQHRQTSAASPGGFTLSELRKLHDSGQITDEEYERARGVIVATSQRDLRQSQHESQQSQAPAEPKGPGFY